MSDDPEEVATRLLLRTAPRIGCFSGDGKNAQYFIFIEDKMLFSVSNISRTIVFWFIVHYIFNLEYCAHIRPVALFFQEFLFGLPATSYPI